LKKLTRDRSEKDAPIDIGDLTQLVRVEVAQLLLKRCKRSTSASIASRL